MTGPIHGPDQQESFQQQSITEDAVKRIQQKKQIERDILIQESGKTVSQMVAAPSTLWAAPQLVKGQFTSDQPADASLKALKNLPPPPSSVQKFQQASAQAKPIASLLVANLNHLIGPGGTLNPPPGLANWGESLFLEMSTKIHMKEAGITQDVLNESLQQSNISLVKLEMINAVAADVENMMQSLENDEIQLKYWESQLNGPGGDASKVAYYSNLIKEVNQNLVVKYNTESTFFPPNGGPAQPVYHPHTFRGDITEFLENWNLYHQWGCTLENAQNIPASVAHVIEQVIFAPNEQDAQNYWHNNVTSPLANYKAAVVVAEGEILKYQGETINRLVIPPGHTASWAKRLPNWRVYTTLNGGHEFIMPSRQPPVNWDVAWASLELAGIQPLPNPGPPPPAGWGSTHFGGSAASIPNLREAIYEKGSGLCFLLGFPPGQINLADIQLALDIAKKMEKFFKKALEALYEKGNGLAVFTVFMTAIQNAQQRNQQIEAESEQKTSDLNLQQLEILQQYNSIISKDLASIDTTLATLASDTSTLQKLQDANWASVALGGLAGLAGLVGMALSFFSFGLSDAVAAAVIAAAGTTATISGSVAAISGASLQSAMGYFQYQEGKATETLSTEQKTLATDQGFVQRTEANSALMSTMSSNTTQSLTSLIQNVIAEEKAALGTYSILSSAVSQAAQA